MLLKVMLPDVAPVVVTELLPAMTTGPVKFTLAPDPLEVPVAPIAVILPSFRVMVPLPLLMVSVPALPPVPPEADPPSETILATAILPVFVVMFTAPPALPLPPELVAPAVLKQPEILTEPEPDMLMAMPPEGAPPLGTPRVTICGPLILRLPL